MRAPLMGRLEKVQRQCLRMATGAYKRTPLAAVERELCLQPMPVCIEQLILERTGSVEKDPVEAEMIAALNKMWTGIMREERPPRPAGSRGRPPTTRCKPDTSTEKRARRYAQRKEEADNLPEYTAPEGEYLGDINTDMWRRRRIITVPKNPNIPYLRKRTRATREIGPYNEARSTTAPQRLRSDPVPEDPGRTIRVRNSRKGGNIHKWVLPSKISKLMEEIWRAKWEALGRSRRAKTWNEPWENSPIELYDGLTKVEAHTTFLLRVEVLGLRSWLASIHVPGVTPECECGWQQETVEHIFTYCTRFNRIGLFSARGGSRGVKGLLGTREGCKAASQWFLKNSVLPYLARANAAVTENRSGFGSAPELEGTGL